MNRGYHVLKCEHYLDGSLGATIGCDEMIEIRGADGKFHWFPKRLTCSSFMSGLKEFSRTAVVRTVYSIVERSLKINQGYDNRYFSVFYRPGRSTRPRPKVQEEEFRKSNRNPTDLDSASKLLETRLEQAEKEARRA